MDLKFDTATSSTFRSAIDRPLTYLEDFLKHRLGLQQYQQHLKSLPRTENDIKVEDDDELDWNAAETDAAFVDPEDQTGSITSRDIIKILQRCDIYEMGRVFQQLSDLGHFLPAYVYSPNDQIEEKFLETFAFRYVTTTIDVTSNDKTSRKKVSFAHDVGLPRVVFISSTGGNSENLISSMFHQVPEAVIDDPGDAGLIVKVGIKSISEKILQHQRPDKREQVEKSRKNWMIFNVVMGDDTPVDEVKNQVLKFLKASDFIIVDKKSVSETVIQWLLQYYHHKQFFWKMDNKNGLQLTNKLIFGDVAFVSKSMTEKILFNTKLPVDSARAPICNEKELLSQNNALSKLVADINNNMSKIEVKDGKTYRRELKLTELFKDRSLLQRNHLAGSIDREKRGEREKEIDEEISMLVPGHCPVAIQILLEILNSETRSEKLIGCIELANKLAEMDKLHLQSDLNEIEELERDLEIDPQSAFQKLSMAKNDMNLKRTTLVHIWRELSQLYVVNNGNVNQQMNPYVDAPKLAAEYFCSGGTIELVDGDACQVNDEWIKKVLVNAHSILNDQLGREAKVLVISVAGVQSSGKSTLLNTLFGVNMDTSVGCCTRGVNLALVPSQGDWSAKCDYVLIMDTEGICNPNFKEEPWYDRHNNWLATLSILGADVCCLLSNNEDDTILRDVLPCAMLAHHKAEDTLTNAGFNKKHVFFVYNRINPSLAMECLKENRLSLMKTLEEKKKDLIEMNKKSGKDPFSLVGNSQFSYLGPDLNDPDAYGRNVVKLRENIDSTLEKDKDFSPVTLQNWWNMFSCLLTALRQQDFALSFKSIVEMKYEIERINFRGQKENEIDHVFHTAFFQVSTQMKQEFQRKGNLDDSLAGDWESKLIKFKKNYGEDDVETLISKATQELRQFLDLHNHKKAKTKVERKWNNFLEKMEGKYKTMVENMYHRYQKEEKVRNDLEKSFLNAMNDIIKDPKRRDQLDKNPEIRSSEFNKLFQDTLDSLELKNKCLNVAEIVHDYWPEEWRAAEIRNSGQNKKCGNSSLDSEGIMNWMKRKIYGYTKSTYILVPLSEQDKILKCIDDYMISLKAHGLRQPNIRADVDGFKKVIISGKLDDIVKTKIANSFKDTLIEIIETNTSKWEEEHNLYMKFRSNKRQFADMFENMCKNKSNQQIAIDNLMVMLWEESIPLYVNHRVVQEIYEKVRNQTFLSNWQVMLAEVNLYILELMEQKKVEDAIKAMRGGNDVLFKVQHQLMDKAVENKPEEHHKKYKDTVMNIFRSELKKLVKNKLLDLNKSELTGEEMKELLITSSPPGFQFPQSILDNFVMICEKIIPDDFLNEVIKMIDTKWPTFENCQWKTKYFPTWEEVREMFPKTKDGLQLQCTELCPHCLSMCMYQEGHTDKHIDHKDKHDCYHQPRGLAGISWGKKSPKAGELSENNCAKNVRDRNTFQWKTEDNYVPYADFEKYYDDPPWKLPQYPNENDEIDVNGQFRQKFFTFYQKELAEFYKKKECSNFATDNKKPYSADQFKKQLKSFIRQQEPEYIEDMKFVKFIEECTTHYEVLRVNPKASSSEIKKSFHSLSKKVHPDKNKAAGATEASKKLNTAYQCLIDVQKRKEYDEKLQREAQNSN